MALTTAQQVRLRIQDTPTVFDHIGTADGQGSAYAVPYRNITSATAFVHDANSQWSATGATVNTSGYVTFSGVITGASAWRVRGVQSVFSEDEIGHMTAVGGSVAGAALEAVRTLMFDSLKRASWAAPDGSQFDDSMAQNTLLKMHDQLTAEVADTTVVDGGFASWAEGQEDYW